MKKVTLIISIIILVILLFFSAYTSPMWAPPFLGWVNANTSVIQGLTSFIQLILYIFAFVLTIIGVFYALKNGRSVIDLIKKAAGIDDGEKQKEKDDKKVDKLINDTQAGSINNPTDDHKNVEELRTDYLTRVFKASSRLSLAGIDPEAASDAGSNVGLGTIYTALLTLPVEKSLSFTRARSVSALSQVNEHQHLVILGDPGSGKTTFVSFLAMCMAGELIRKSNANIETLIVPLPKENGEDGSEKQPWQHGALIPLRFVLRDFAARGLPELGQKGDSNNLFDFLSKELGELNVFIPFLKKELLEKGGLVMFDGLDEVSDADKRRTQIREVIADFVDDYPKCRILVTSRTLPYQKQGWRLPKFSEAVLSPFSQGQIIKFIDKWYFNIAPLRQFNIENAKGQAVLLKQAIFTNERLYNLAERPLLLTLMASLHAWRGGSLPDKRERLYEAAVDLLLESWQKLSIVRDTQGEIQNPLPSLTAWLQIDREKLRKLLEELAFKAHSDQPDIKGTADIPEGELLSGLLEICNDPKIRENIQANPKALLDFLSQRAGILIPRGIKIYTFPHRTFQEYLAACYLTDNDFPDLIASLVKRDPDRWEEVALLAGAKAAGGAAGNIWLLADCLCCEEPGRDLNEVEDIRGALTAGKVLIESANLEKIKGANLRRLELIKRWNIYIIEKENIPLIDRLQAGNILDKLGDPRFDADLLFLPSDPFWGFIEIPDGDYVIYTEIDNDESLGERAITPTTVPVPRFFISRFPVTVSQYKLFIEKTNYPCVSGLTTSKNNHPIVNISWKDAVSYCDWLCNVLIEWAQNNINTQGTDTSSAILSFYKLLASGNITIKLPSEVEWEKASRGNNNWLYPWGNEFDIEKANIDETQINGTCPVGCFPGGKSPYGVEDMIGNVWEWTRSISNIETKVDEETDNGHTVTPRYILKGGSFDDRRNVAKCTYKTFAYPDSGSSSFGFRTAIIIKQKVQ